MHAIHVVDSHTGGEPTRTVVSGFPDLGAGPVSAQLARLRDSHDRYRRAVVGEPRSSDVAVGALLLPPDDASATAGVIFFNNAGYLGMCGHGAIGVIATLAHLGRIAPGVHRLDTPVGRVAATLHESGDVSIDNVPAFRHRAGVAVAVAGVGEVVGDVAWGGNWFFLVRSPVVEISASRVAALSAMAGAIQSAVDAAGVRGADGARIDHIELFADSPTPDCHSRNFVRCPGGEYDRSPCGTGTSAKLACLAADGALAPGDIWRQESVIGSVFEATYRWEDGRAGMRILPTIRGRANLCAEGDLLLDPTDSFCWGIGP